MKKNRTCSVGIGLGIILLLCLMIVYIMSYLSKNIETYLVPINQYLTTYCEQSLSCPAVFDPADFAWTQSFRDGWRGIRDEFLAYTQAHDPPAYADIDSVYSSCNLNGGWKTVFLRAYGADTEAMREFPETSRLIRGAPCTLAFFSVLEPGARLAPHHGVYKGVIRYHLGLIVPDDTDNCFIDVDGQKLHWGEGRDLMFDDLYLHHVENNTQQRRVVLFLDIRRDFRNVFMNMLNTALLRVIRSNDAVKTTVKTANLLNAA